MSATGTRSRWARWGIHRWTDLIRDRREHLPVPLRPSRRRIVPRTLDAGRARHHIRSRGQGSRDPNVDELRLPSRRTTRCDREHHLRETRCTPRHCSKCRLALVDGDGNESCAGSLRAPRGIRAAAVRRGAPHHRGDVIKALDVSSVRRRQALRPRDREWGQHECLLRILVRALPTSSEPPGHIDSLSFAA